LKLLRLRDKGWLGRGICLLLLPILGACGADKVITPENPFAQFVSISVTDTVYTETLETVLLTLETTGLPPSSASTVLPGELRAIGGVGQVALSLHDYGEDGDVVPGDGVFTTQFTTEFAGTPGLWEVVVTLDSYFELRDTILVVSGSKNFPPVLSNLVAPDSLFLDAPPVNHYMYVDVVDPQGAGDIAEVIGHLYFPGFTSPNATLVFRREGIPPELLPGPNSYVYIFQPRDLALYGPGAYQIRFLTTDHHGQTGEDLVATTVAISNEANLPPVLSELTVPDTVQLPPPGNDPLLLLVTVRATDPNGQSTMRSVWFDSFRPDGRPSTANPVNMLDDGGLSAGNVSGDDVAGDGVYSTVIQLPPPTPTGDYEFRFHANDFYQAESDSIIHIMTIEE
jgi:hypothetical protein